MNIHDAKVRAAKVRKERTGFAYPVLRRVPGKKYPYRGVKRGGTREG